MSDLEKFMHNEEIHVPHLIKIAIIHYQFETIHPFLDGNGRLGRLLIILYLVSFKLLAKPALYMSDFFERNKAEYFHHLMAARTNNEMTEWIKFFLFGLKETAERSINVLKRVLTLKEKIERELLPTIHKRSQKNAQMLLESLYQHPIITIGRVAEMLNIQNNTASKLVGEFTKLGILQELTGKRRNRLFLFKEYASIFTE